MAETVKEEQMILLFSDFGRRSDDERLIDTTNPALLLGMGLDKCLLLGFLDGFVCLIDLFINLQVNTLRQDGRVV